MIAAGLLFCLSNLNTLSTYVLRPGDALTMEPVVLAFAIAGGEVSTC